MCTRIVVIKITFNAKHYLFYSLPVPLEMQNNRMLSVFKMININFTFVCYCLFQQCSKMEHGKFFVYLHVIGKVVVY